MTKLISVDITIDGKTEKAQCPEDVVTLLLELQQSKKINEKVADLVASASSFAYSAGLVDGFEAGKQETIRLNSANSGK